MIANNIPLRHPVLPVKHRESSGLRSELDGDALQRQHIKLAQMQAQIEGLQSTCAQLVAALRRARRTGTVEEAPVGTPTDWFRGEWTPTMAVLHQQMVIHTPGGGHAGCYVCILDAPIGYEPSNGAPYYTKLPVDPTGVYS